MALFRRHGVFVKATHTLDEEQWPSCLRRLPRSPVLRQGLQLVREIYAHLTAQEKTLRAGLIGLAKQQEPICRFEVLAGMGWIRSVTFYAYIDAPERFRSKAALWRYSGIGLE